MHSANVQAGRAKSALAQKMDSLLKQIEKNGALPSRLAPAPRPHGLHLRHHHGAPRA
jgi:hypothetical protein